MQDGTAETVARVRHGHAGGSPDPADAADRDCHRPFPVSEDMSDAGADGRVRRIAPPVFRAPEYPAVRRASVSFRAARAGPSGRIPAVLPPAPARSLPFPALRRRGAGTGAASTVRPPAGPLPRSRSRSPEAADRDVNAPPRASLSRNGRTVLRSGAGPPVRDPGNRGRPGRSRTGNPVRPSPGPSIDAGPGFRDIVTGIIYQSAILPLANYTYYT